MGSSAKPFVIALVAALLFAGLGVTGAYSEGAAPAEEPVVTGAANADSPRLEAAPEEFDFGTVEEGEKPKALFTLTNTGGSELVIYDAKPSCGCTLASLSTKKLMPGETATLEAVYNSHNARQGKVSKYVTVKTNDPATPSKVLRITGNVNVKPAPMLALNPVIADRLALPAGAVEKRRVQLRNPGQIDLLITELTTSEGMSAKFGELDVEAGKTVKTDMAVKPGQIIDIYVDISPKAEAGAQFRETLTIRSNAKGKPAVAFMARGVVQ